MDTKRFFTSMLIAGLIMLAVMMFFRSSGGGAESKTVRNPIYNNVPETPLPGFSEGGETPKTVVLGGWKEPNDSLLAVTIDNVTAGIDKVEINPKNYASSYDHSAPLTLFQAEPKQGKPFSTIGVHVWLGDDKDELNLGRNAGTLMLDTGYIWKVVRADSTDAVLSCTIFYPIDGKKTDVCRITKHFHLDPKSYELTISHDVENLLQDRAIRVQIDQLGAPGLARDDPRADDRYFHGLALNSSKKTLDSNVGYNMAWAGLRKDILNHKDHAGTTPVGQLADFGNNPQLWIASANRFFTVIIRPEQEKTGTTDAEKHTFKADANQAEGFTLDDSAKTKIDKPTHVNSVDLDLMALGAEDKAADDVAILRLTGSAIKVPAGKSVEEPLSVYMGPKKRDILGGDVAAGGRAEFKTYQYIKMVQLNSCVIYSFCFVEQIGMWILTALDWMRIHVAFGNYGVAIMILVIVVRALLHPLTRSSQISMAKMGKQMRDVQPQLNAIKKRYPDDKRKQSEETMRVYRENNVNPAGGIMGCLPMLLQMPIWAALYAGLSSDVDLRHSVFIPGWISDLAVPDRVLPLGVAVPGHPLFTIPFVNFEIYGLNLLPLLIATVFYFQMKISTATQPKPADEQQAQMQKMSQYMIFIFPLMLYNAPAGLNLYIFASTLAGIVDTTIVRRTLKKQGILAPTAQLLPTHEEKVEKPE